MVLFCDFRSMEVLRDEKGRKSAAFGFCFWPQSSDPPQNRKVPSNCTATILLPWRKRKVGQHLPHTVKSSQMPKVVSRYCENIKRKCLYYPSPLHNTISISCKESLGNFVPSGEQLLIVLSWLEHSFLGPCRKHFSSLLCILKSEIYKENLYNFISTAGLTL